MQIESKITKNTQVVVTWLSRVLFKRETVDCVILQQMFGENSIFATHRDVFE